MGWNLFSIWQAQCKKEDEHLPKDQKRTKTQVCLEFHLLEENGARVQDLRRLAQLNTGPLMDTPQKRKAYLHAEMEDIKEKLDHYSAIDGSSFLLIKYTPSPALKPMQGADFDACSDIIKFFNQRCYWKISMCQCRPQEVSLHGYNDNVI